RVRPGDHVHRDQLAHPLGAAGTRFGGRLHRCHVPSHDCGDVAAADLFVAHELHLGCLHHGICRLDHAHETLGFDHPQRFSHRFDPPISAALELAGARAHLSLKGAVSLPEIPFSEATAASAAESISASAPAMYSLPKAPNGVTSTNRTSAAFSASLAASAA